MENCITLHVLWLMNKYGFMMAFLLVLTWSHIWWIVTIYYRSSTLLRNTGKHCNLCLMVYSIFHDALILYKFQNCYFALLVLHGWITMCDSQVIVFYSCTLFILLQVLHNCYILFAMAHMALHQSKIIADWRKKSMKWGLVHARHSHGPTRQV